MNLLSRLFFGSVEFPESEEFREFQYKFLIVLHAFGAIATGFFIWISQAGAVAMPEQHMQSMKMFTVASVLLLFIVRSRPKWFYPVAVVSEVVSLLELASALIYVPADELRILWVFANIPAVYLLLGRRVGSVVTLGVTVGLVLGNPYMAAPYSPNALATAVISMIYAGAFFFAYARQTIYFFMRMRESNDRLRDMATRDALTGVLNARAYYEVCDRLIRLAQRNNSPYSVLFVDLDHFKSINDTYGHAAGDIVLKSVSNCLVNSLRHSDALGRIGGEEFSIFLPNTDIGGAVLLAENIRAAIEILMPSTGEQQLKITASIGVARNQHSEQSMLEIQQQADQAMYHAKAKGRNRVSSFDIDEVAAVHA
jgi:diguanylate cyclase (GGDEF)-like protein